MTIIVSHSYSIMLGRLLRVKIAWQFSVEEECSINSVNFSHCDQGFHGVTLPELVRLKCPLIPKDLHLADVNIEDCH